jgi:ABC-type transporter Mla MlaB component
MLRITTIDTPAKQKLILEGRLTEPWVAELDFLWEKIRQVLNGRKFVVDLSGVTRIDTGGESALARRKRKGGVSNQRHSEQALGQKLAA